MRDRYTITERLDHGGMAEVFRGVAESMEGFKKSVAIKRILPNLTKNDKFVKMFLDEARITAAFSHANIGQVFDLGEEEGELYLAMEFISGQNLEQVMKRAKKRDTPIPIGFSARVVRDWIIFSMTWAARSPRPAVSTATLVSPGL